MMTREQMAQIMPKTHTMEVWHEGQKIEIVYVLKSDYDALRTELAAVREELKELLSHAPALNERLLASQQRRIEELSNGLAEAQGRVRELEGVNFCEHL